MSHPQIQSPTKTIPQASTFPTKVTKSYSFDSRLPGKRPAESYPVAVGSTGTVGSLITQEIEYLTGLDMGSGSSSNKTGLNSLSDESSRLNKLKSERAIAGKKKKPGGSKLIPSMCSSVEVASQLNKVSGLARMNLKADLKRLRP